MSRRALGLLAAVAVAAAAGCGARLSDEQHDRVLAGAGALSSGAATASPGATAPSGPGALTAVAGGSAGSQGRAATKGTTTTQSGPTGQNPPGPTCTATPSNNGGATDKGVTATTIKIGLVADVSGPVPGLFTSAVQAGQAFVAYFNQTYADGLCGRKLVLEPRDSRTDSGGNKTATQDSCASDFAIVGSMSAFDDGGADPVSACGIVDISAIAVTAKRQNSPDSFAASSANTDYVAAIVPDYLRKSFGDAYRNAGFLYINAGAAKENGEADIKAYKNRGWHFSYTAAVPVQSATTQGFKPYVQRMKKAGVTLVTWLGAFQEAASLAQAIEQSDYHPVFVLDPTGYNPQYVEQAKGAAEGTYVYDDAVPLSEPDANAELALYTQWLQRSGASAGPTYFGQFAWSAMRLFTELALKAGPRLTREAIKKQLPHVAGWTDHGMHAPMGVGEKKTGGCYGFSQVRNGAFVKVTGLMCGERVFVG